MNILDNLPTKFMKEFVERGGDITFTKTSDGIALDLNTGMKSRLHLTFDGENYIAHCRYDTNFTIETFYDLFDAIRWCEADRGFMSDSIRTFYVDGFEDNFAKFC